MNSQGIQQVESGVRENYNPRPEKPLQHLSATAIRPCSKAPGDQAIGRSLFMKTNSLCDPSFLLNGYTFPVVLLATPNGSMVKNVV